MGIKQLDKYYITSDLCLTATISLFHPLDAIDKSNPSKAQFRFRKDVQFDQLIEKFWRREVKVEPQAYFQQLKIIKSRLYSEGEGR